MRGFVHAYLGMRKLYVNRLSQEFTVGRLTVSQINENGYWAIEWLLKSKSLWSFVSFYHEAVVIVVALHIFLISVSTNCY